MKLGRLLAVAAALLTLAPRADAGCGCDKPPPPIAAIRPFVAWSGGTVTLFDGRLVPGTHYRVFFDSVADRWEGWAEGDAQLQPDLADGRIRSQLSVVVPQLGLGPQKVQVWNGNVLVYELDPSLLTLTGTPIPLHDIQETVSRDKYRGGVGTDGTVYIALDVSGVSNATSFQGAAVGFPLDFGPGDITMYNDQGFLMQHLPEAQEGVLFDLVPRKRQTSATLSYWRHEFNTYNEQHRELQDRQLDASGNWHADGSYHVDHDLIVVAIHGTLQNGNLPEPGRTPQFRLQIASTPAAAVQ